MLAAVLEKALNERSADCSLAGGVGRLEKRHGGRIRNGERDPGFGSAGDEKRVEAAVRARGSPAEMDAEAGVIGFEVEEVLRVDGLGMDAAERELAEIVAEAGGGGRGIGGGNAVEREPVVLDTGVGDGADAEGFPALLQMAPHLREGIGGSRFEGDGGQLRPGADVKDDIVAVAGHLVVGAAAAQGDFHVADAGDSTAKREKPGG